MGVDSLRLETSLEDVSGVAVVKATGEIDVSTAPRLSLTLQEVVAAGSAKIIVDMTDVGYMDSSGFGALVGAVKLVKPLGGAVGLVGCPKSIERLMSITRLDSIIGSYESVDDALKAMA
jgi:anti-sigma B factor antagonist